MQHPCSVIYSIHYPSNFNEVLFDQFVFVLVLCRVLGGVKVLPS